MTFITKVYKETAALPDIKKFGLIQQMRRCAISIASNIAEGSGRSTDRDFVNFLHMSLGSTYELETQILLCKQLSYWSDVIVDLYIKDIGEVQKMIIGLINSLKSKL